MPPSASRRSAAALVALVLLVTAGPGVAGASDAPEGIDGFEVVEGSDGQAPPDIEVDEPLVAPPDEGVRRPFLVVPGVDLRRLGYDGPSLDADVIDRATDDLPDEPRERVAEISGRLDALPSQLDGLTEAEGLLERALARLDADADAAEGSLAVGTLRSADADARVADADARLRERVDQLAGHRRQMAEVAVAAYVRPPDADALSRVLGGAATTSDDLTASVLFSAKADHDGLVRDSLEVARAVAVERLALAQRDADAARERVAAAEATLRRAEARRDAHRQALGEVAAARAELERTIPALQEDMDRTIEETWGALHELAAGGAVDGNAIVSVDGIRIHAAIAHQLQALLAAARADGVPLGGWGHRTIESQIRLREAHCGPTPEDIWLKPAGECRPPTARPGASMHERGLAVDFHLAGRSISTRSSPGFQWLAANAATYGFYNLPSEPWHWSVNGQ